MATHSSVLAWRIPGAGEPGGLPSMGSHRVGHDWNDLAAAAINDLNPNWCFWIVVLEKTLESPLDCKEIKPFKPKENQPWTIKSVTQFRSVQLLSRVLTLCDLMDCSTPGLPVHHQLLEFTEVTSYAIRHKRLLLSSRSFGETLTTNIFVEQCTFISCDFIRF